MVVVRFLSTFQLDNHGNRLLALDDSGINTPAIAAAHTVRRFDAQAMDDISLQVGQFQRHNDHCPSSVFVISLCSQHFVLVFSGPTALCFLRLSSWISSLPIRIWAFMVYTHYWAFMVYTH